jgi:hypothetical protein
MLDECECSQGCGDCDECYIAECECECNVEKTVEIRAYELTEELEPIEDDDGYEEEEDDEEEEEEDDEESIDIESLGIHVEDDGDYN